MKKLLFLLAFQLISNLLSADSSVQTKIDSVCVLVKKYFNEKKDVELYSLCGERFKNSLSPEAFKSVCLNNLFPLGEIKQTVFEKFDNGVSKYKAVFASMNLSLLLSLDKSDKIEVFLFKPYTDEKAKKSYRAPSINTLRTLLDKEIDSAMQRYICMEATAGVSIGIFKDGNEVFYGYGKTVRRN